MTNQQLQYAYWQRMHQQAIYKYAAGAGKQKDPAVNVEIALEGQNCKFFIDDKESSTKVFPKGGNVSVEVSPNSGYKFKSWYDENTDNPRVWSNVQTDISAGAITEEISSLHMTSIQDQNVYKFNPYDQSINQVLQYNSIEDENRAGEPYNNFSALSDIKWLKTVYTTENSLSAIGERGICACDKLLSVSLPSVVSVGSQCFEACRKLKYVDLRNVQVFGENVFRECDDLSTIILSGVTEVPYINVDFTFAPRKSYPISVYVKNEEMKTNFEEDSSWSSHILLQKVVIIPVE